MAAKPEDLNLPASVVAKLVKDSLPSHVNISKEARTAIGRAASIFVLYTTACANNVATAEKRKTITPEDILAAMKDMEMDQFVNPLRKCLDAYRKASNKSNPKSRVQSAASTTGVSASAKSKKSPQKSSSKPAAEKVPSKEPKSHKDEKVLKKSVSKTENVAQKIASELQAQEDSDLSSSSDGVTSDKEVSPGKSKRPSDRTDEPMEVEQNDVRTKTASGLSASTDSDDSSLD